MATILTLERDHITYIHTYLLPRLPALTSNYQENVSLNPMIKSMEVARYSSGIMRTLSLLSSNTPYTPGLVFLITMTFRHTLV
jgi:hypothetical protein